MTPEHFWYAVGPLTDEEAGCVGGTPAEIVGVEVPADDNGPAETYHIATFNNEKERDRAVECHNTLVGMVNPSADLARLRAELDAANKRAEEAEKVVVKARQVIEFHNGGMSTCDDPEDGCAEYWEVAVEELGTALAAYDAANKGEP